MNDVLTTDDPLYEELYDVSREAKTFGNAVEGDIYPRLNELRDRAPVQQGYVRALLGLPEYHRIAGAVGKEGYSTFSYDACVAAFSDTLHLSSSILHRPNGSEKYPLGILEMDGQEHRGMRKALQPVFNKPVAFDWWRKHWIDETVARLIERLKTQQTAELNIDFCARIPVHTITIAIGLEAAESLAFRTAYMKSTGTGVKSPQERQEAAAIVESTLYGLIEKRKAEPRDDIISKLLSAGIKEKDGTKRPLTDEEIMVHARVVLLAGGGTTWRQMGITLFALLTHPQQLEALRADRTLMERTVDESIRWNATDPVFHRIAIADLEIAGVHIPEGSVVEICLGAANRDPSRWENPNAFDIHRPQKTNLGFGLGAHRCLGMNVAHSEIAAGVNALLDAFPAMRIDPSAPEPCITGGVEQRGISPLRVLLK